MRVAHILRKYIPQEWGGTETALQGLAGGLAAHGARSLIYSPEAGPLPASDPLAAIGCEHRRYRACVPVWGLSEDARKQMLAVGGNILSFDLPGMLAREPAIDAIHTHVLGRIGGIAGAAARRRQIPFVVSIHGGFLDIPASVREQLAAPSQGGFEWGRVFGWWWRARHVVAEADAVLTCNRREADLLRERNPEQLIIVQPHGVDTQLFRTDHREAARRAFPQIVDRDVLLIVARVDPTKNQLWVVREMARIRERHPRALLVLAGACTNAAYGSEVRRQIEQLGLDGHVLLTGGLPPGDDRVVGLLQEARVKILPSLAETFGLVILEAWAAGSPVIATATSGSRELIRDGETGCFFDLEKPEQFHATLDRVLTDAGLRQHLITGGGRQADEHDITALAGRVKNLYSYLREEKYALRDSA